MDGDGPHVETDRRDHGGQVAGASFGAQRCSWMKPKSRRGGEDAAALEIGFGRAGTHRLRFAPDPQRRRAPPLAAARPVGNLAIAARRAAGAASAAVGGSFRFYRRF